MTTQYWAEEAELYDVEQWARGRVMWENITSGQFGDCLVYLGLLIYSGLENRCNVWKFWIDCDAALNSMGIMLSTGGVE